LLPSLGIGYLNSTFLMPLWFYAFFDTFHIFSKIKRGEQVSDYELIFGKQDGSNADKQFYFILAWILIVVGILAIVNKIFEGNQTYFLVISSISTYFFPVLLIAGGIYLLMK